ncbi:hypothetical protein BV898_05744, partial [Hypsibius exemplaris]
EILPQADTTLVVYDGMYNLAATTTLSRLVLEDRNRCLVSCVSVDVELDELDPVPDCPNDGRLPYHLDLGTLHRLLT